MNTVGILWSIHGADDFIIEKGYTIDMMKDIIVGFKPDIIYGEVKLEQLL